MSTTKPRPRVRSEAELKRGWRAYKLTLKAVDCIREKDAKRGQRAWLACREHGGLTIFTGIGDPTKSGHPRFVAARIDYRGKTVLESIYNEHRHDVLTFTPGPWERDLRKLASEEARHG